MTLRVSRGVENSQAGGNGGGGGCSPPESSFITLDSRKRQISVRDVTARKVPGKASVPKIFGFDSVFSPEDTQVSPTVHQPLSYFIKFERFRVNYVPVPLRMLYRV